MYQDRTCRRRGALALTLTPILTVLGLSAIATATTPAAPGVETPQHIKNHIKLSAVSMDEPGGWRTKALRAKSARQAGAPRSAGAVTGVLEVPVLCFGFDNINLPVDTAPDLQQELFDGPWPTGTLSEYYREISYGKFSFDGRVTDIGNLSGDDTDYQGSNGFGGSGNGIGANNDAPYVYLNESLTLADTLIDFSAYDNDGPDGIPNSGDDDGIVDLVALVHPEIGGECGGPNIWSHRWTYSSANWYATGTSGSFSTNDPSANGGQIQINDYTIMPALSCNNTLIEIGVFCHEFGHALGLPDLYGTGNSSNAGCGYFCLMAAGNWNSPERPGHMSAWCRAELGWILPQLVIGDYTGLVLPAIEDQPFAIKVQHDPNSTEYLLIENRQAIGFDQNLPGCGLAIWHVDPAVATGNDIGWCSGNFNAPHSMVALEQSDGLCEMESGDRGDNGDLWHAAGPANVFDPNTSPDSRPYSGQDTGVKISNISVCGNTMTIDLSVHPLPINEIRPLDVLFVFDTSGSYWDDLPGMLAQMPSVMSEIAIDFPNPRFAVANFTDFPVSPNGSLGDEAWEVNLDFTSNAATVATVMGTLTASGGNDLPESQYEAIYQAMTGSGLDLNNDGDFTDTGEIAPQPLSWDANRAPIIFLMTDADFHDADVEDYPVGAGEANGRAALLAEIAAPGTMAEAPRIFTLNAAWEGPAISSGFWDGHGDNSSYPNNETVLERQATELAVRTGGKFIFAGANTVEFLEGIREALEIIKADQPAGGLCCTTDGDCFSPVTQQDCELNWGGVWSQAGGCEVDCNDNQRSDTCEILLGLTADDNGNGIPDECECVGDINGDFMVNIDDLLKVLNVWGCVRDCPNEDLNGDDVVDVGDLLIILDSWGDCGG